MSGLPQKLLFTLSLIFTSLFGKAQYYEGGRLPHIDSVDMLLTSVPLQIEITEGINSMYNFKFEAANSQFRWIQKHYPTHPLPYFLLGLSYWWRILPDLKNDAYDETIYAYLDSAIHFAEVMEKQEKGGVEPLFLLASSHGLKSQLLAYRKNWGKAIFAGKAAVKYMNEGRGQSELLPEILYGDGLYNYYVEWIPDNYPMLKPVLTFFDDGDMAKGLEQLERASHESFYARIEAQYTLMRIYTIEENQLFKAYNYAKSLHGQFPDNSYFHRYYARLLYLLGMAAPMKRECLQIISRIENGMQGYEANSGRYAAFFLGDIYLNREKNTRKAKKYYEMAVKFGEQNGAYESGFYLYSLSWLADIARAESDLATASFYYQKIKKHAGKKHTTMSKANEFRKEHRKEWKKAKKKQKKEEDKGWWLW